MNFEEWNVIMFCVTTIQFPASSGTELQSVAALIPLTTQRRQIPPCLLDQWYSTFFVRVPPDIISLQLCTPKVVGT
jgi:hypothetical protein